MMMVRASVKLALFAVLAVLAPAAAEAADSTRYISMTGSNAAACTLAQPCRTLQRGINRTPAGGELRILESGAFGPNATISRSLTITGNGHTVFLGNPITIDAAGAVVTLRGLTLNGQGTVARGIDITAAVAVHIERCVIHGFPENGIRATADGIEVFVLDSVLRDNGLGFIIFEAGASQVTVDNSRFENNFASGVRIHSGDATIHRSTASGNSLTGIGVAHNASVSVKWTVAAQNGGSGLHVGSSGIARIANSTFTGNATGIINSGTVRTLGNNVVDGNGNNAVAGTVQAVTPF